MPPKVSVIMPTYNGAKFIKKSMDSVSSQTFKDFELIIINDGSTDNTKDIIRRYHDKRIIYLENKKNQGASKARNKGLRYAHGEYIAYCDHDDIYYPRHLQRLCVILEAHPKVGLVYSNYLVRTPRKPPRIFPINKTPEEKLAAYNTIGPPLNVMHRMECIKKVGDFDESPIIKMNAAEDYDLWLRILEYYECYHINETLGEYILHGRNRTYDMDFAKSHIYILNKKLHSLNIKSQLLTMYINQSIDRTKGLLESSKAELKEYALIFAKGLHNLKKTYQTFACLGLCSLAKGRFKDAIRYLNDSLRLMPKQNYKTDKILVKNRIMINLNLARAYLQLNRINEAINICLKSLYFNRNEIDIKQTLVKSYIRKGIYSKALKILAGMKDFNAYILRGSCHFHKNKFYKAIKEFKKAKKENPTSNIPYYNLGLAYMKLNECKKAIKEFKWVLQLTPNYSAAEKIILRLSLNQKYFPLSPKVSIIMPTYNRANIISRAIKSVLNQTFKDFELIIVNDGSTDNTNDVVSRFNDKRIVYLEKTHAGPASARNLGLNYALGEYIAYLDDDDIYYQNHLKELVKFLDSHLDIGMVYSDFLMVSPENKRLGKIRCVFNKKGLETKCLFSLSTVMHRRHCLDRAGFFDEKLLKCQDWDMWLRISDFYKISYLPKLLTEYMYCSEPQSRRLTNIFYKTVIKKRIRKAKQEKRILEYIDNYAIQAIKELISYNNLNYACRLAKEFYKIIKNYNTVACLGLCNLAKGKFKKAQSQFKSSLMKLPKNWRKLDPWHVEKILNIVIHLAEAYYNLNNILPAERLYKRALNIMPRNTFLKVKEGLAKCYINCGLFDDALNLLRQYNHSSLAYNLRGICYFKNGHYKRAIRELETALIFEPDSEIYRHNLATIQKVINAKT